MKRIGYITLGFVLILIVLYLLARPYVIRQSKQEFVRTLERLSGAPVTLDDLQVGVLLNHIRIEGLAIGSANSTNQTLHLKLLDVHYNPLSLFSDTVSVTSLTLDIPFINFEQYADGGTNFDWVQELSGQATTTPVVASPGPSPLAVSSTGQENPALEAIVLPSPEMEGPVEPVQIALPPAQETFSVEEMTRQSLLIDRFALRLGTIKILDQRRSEAFPASMEVEIDFDETYEQVESAESLRERIEEDLLKRTVGLGFMDDLREDVEKKSTIPEDELKALELELEQLEP